ncbi:MAG: hypothetical protein GW802_00645, partial [Armatimonadetes bacterium]|nr:hypothetical protein [Armatimonadota bacterium]
MDVEAFLQSLRQAPEYAGQIVHVHTEPARSPRCAPLPEGLRPEVTAFLEGLGATTLYSHQAEA